MARTICLDLLTAAPRTRAELATKLRSRGVPDDVAARVLDRFVDVGLIDDAAYAATWAQARHRDRGLARRALTAELRRKGVAPDDIAAAIEPIDSDQEAARARALVDKRIVSTRGLPAPTRVRRLASMLARKGYPPGVAFAVVREALAGEGFDVGGDGDQPDLAEPDGDSPNAWGTVTKS